MWTHSSWIRRPHFIEIDENDRISYNGNIFHGSAEYHDYPPLGGPRINLHFSPVRNVFFLRRFVFIHILGTVNYLYEHQDNYSCILMPLTKENFQLPSSSSSGSRRTVTTLDHYNPQGKRRRTVTTAEEDEELTFKEFEKAQDDFVEPSAEHVIRAIELTSAHLKDQLLRSTLCKQPESGEHADNIIVNNVMSAAAVEQHAVVTRGGSIITEVVDSSASSSTDLN